jgi:hypothetical protein
LGPLYAGSSLVDFLGHAGHRDFSYAYEIHEPVLGGGFLVDMCALAFGKSPKKQGLKAPLFITHNSLATWWPILPIQV